MIYVVQEEHSGLVKIGLSDDPWARHGKMQSDCPGKLTVLCLEAGDGAYERELHARFSADRVRGEWFRYSDRIAAYVASVGPALRPGASPLSEKAALVWKYVSVTGVPPMTARSWIARGSIPTRHWSALVRAGVTTLGALAEEAAARHHRSAA